VISAVPDSFTFEVLDDLSFAAAGQRLPTLPQGAYRFDGLGPALELARLSTCGLLPPPTQAPWLVLDDAANLANALRDGRRVWTCREKHLGFLRMQAEPPADDTEGNAFQLEAQRAATAVGFPAKLAAQLVGAFEEIHSNVYDIPARRPRALRPIGQRPVASNSSLAMGEWGCSRVSRAALNTLISLTTVMRFGWPYRMVYQDMEKEHHMAKVFVRSSPDLRISVAHCVFVPAIRP